MGLQSISCPCGSLFLLGMLQIVGFMDKRKLIIDNIFKDFFTAPDTESQWQDIREVIEPHGLKKMLPTGATPSKPPRQGDGSLTPFKVNRAVFNLAMMYKTAAAKDILIDEPGMECFFDPRDNPNQHMEGALKWNVLITAFETCYEIESNVRLMLEAIKPLYHSEAAASKSPAQLYFFVDEFMHGTLIKPDSLVVVPWETIDQFKTDNLMDPGIIDVMFNFDVTKLWFIPVPTLTWGSGGGAHPVDPGVFFINDSGAAGIAFDKGGSFIPDALNVEDPPGIPPIATSASCNITLDNFNSGIWRTSVTPGVPGTAANDSGVVTVTYQTLTVT